MPAPAGISLLFRVSTLHHRSTKAGPALVVVELQDSTPWDAPSVDVLKRCSWLLRTMRMSRGVTMLEMSRQLAEVGVRASPARLSSIESTGRCDPEVTTGYERVLGLGSGSLWAPQAILQRTFPRGDRRSPRRVHRWTASEYSSLQTAVRTSDATAGEWLAWAEAVGEHERPGSWTTEDRNAALGLTRSVGRAVGTVYAVRYEALALLRTGPWRDLVLACATEIVAEPHVQMLLDIVSAVSDSPDEAMVAWASELICDPRPSVVEAGAMAITNGLAVGGVEDSVWCEIVDPLIAAFAQAEPGGLAHGALSALVFELPAHLWQSIRASVRAKVAPPQHVGRYDQLPRSHRIFSLADQAVADLAARVRLTDTALVERLVFEFLQDFRLTRAVTSFFLLGATPLVEPLWEVLVPLLARHATPGERARLLDRVAMMQSGLPLALPPSWGASLTPAEHGRFLLIQAQAGQEPARTAVESVAAAGGVARRHAICAAGIAGVPWLSELTERADDPALRGAAAWWLEQGERVTH